MNKWELAKLGYFTDDLSPDIDYVPVVEFAGDEAITDFVARAYQQMTELDAMGGVNILGGSRERRDAINHAMEDGFDLLAAVELFGDESQSMLARQLIDAGKISN